MAKALLFGLMGVAMGLHLQGEDKGTLSSSSTYSIQSDSGLFLASCRRCNQAEPNNALLKDTDPKTDASTAWVLEKVDSYYFIKNLEDSHLIDRRLNGASFTQQRDEDDNRTDDHWVPQQLSNEKWIFRTQDGRGYLGRCGETIPCVIRGPRDVNNFSRIQWTVKNSSK